MSYGIMITRLDCSKQTFSRFRVHATTASLTTGGLPEPALQDVDERGDARAPGATIL